MFEYLRDNDSIERIKDRSLSDNFVTKSYFKKRFTCKVGPRHVVDCEARSDSFEFCMSTRYALGFTK